MKKISVLATFIAKEDKINDLRKLLVQLLEPTRLERGCINYDLHQVSDNPAKFFLYENWESKELLDDHLESPHLIYFKKHVNDFLEKDLNVEIANKVER